MSVPVGGFCDWGWDDDTSCVDGLPDVASIDTSGNFLNQSWSQSLGPKVLMNTQKVYFSHQLLLTVHIHVHWNTRDESEQLVFLSSSDTK